MMSSRRRTVVQRASLVAAIALAGFVAQASQPLAPDAAAQDKDKDKDKDGDRKKKDDEEEKRREEERKKRRLRREKALKAIAVSFGAEDPAGVLVNVGRNAKVRLTLGADDGDYSRDQARGILDKYFERMQSIDVDTSKMNAEENVASFPVKVRKNRDEKPRAGKLYVTVSKEGDHALMKLVVEL